MITTSDTTKAISAALLQFQGHVSGVKRDAKNPHFRSNYATLENVIDTARPVLQEFGVMFMQAPGAIVDGALEVTTRLSHAESGEWIQATMHMPLGKRDPQGAGSATTYGLRYSLMAMLGLPPTDDDGEAAMIRDEPRETPNTVTGPAIKPMSAAQLKKHGEWDQFMNDLYQCTTVNQINGLYKAIAAPGRKIVWNDHWLRLAVDECAKFKADLLGKEQEEADADTFPGDLPSNSNSYVNNVIAGE